MDEYNEQKRQRWYDKDETLAQSVNLLKNFPEEFQSILGEILIELTDKQANAKDLMLDLRALGPDKVLAIFKAKSRQRFYDTNDQVHEAMNHLYILPEEDQIAIAKRIIDVTGHFNAYFEICKNENRQPDPQIVSQLGATYLSGELNNNNLRQYVTELEKNLKTPPKGAVNVPEETKLQSGQSGMKIRLDKPES